MSKKKIVIVAFILVVGIVITGLAYTFAADSTMAGSGDSYTITLTESANEVVLPAKSSKTIMYQLTNTNKGVVQYGVAYSGSNVSVKIYYNSPDNVTGTVDYGENKFIKLYIENNNDTENTVLVKGVLGYEHGGTLNTSGVLSSGYSLVSEVYYPLTGASLYITNLYLNNLDSTPITHNSVEYNVASSVGLMNDRLGGTTEDYNAGNVRYYGSTPDNYVYFNCDDYSNQSADTCERWRIIGVFDGKLKIIRDEVLGNYIWDNKYSGVGSSLSDSGSNDWSDARLMMLLNDGYEDGVVEWVSEEVAVDVYASEGSLYWNGKSGICYNAYTPDAPTGTCDFTSTGIKNDVTRSMVEKTNWNLGGPTASGIYVDAMYKHEIGGNTAYSRPTTWNGEVGLMYVSDYGYAADLSTCTSNLNKFNNCTSTNWLYTEDFQWTMTVYSNTNRTYYAMNVFANGGVGHYEKPVSTELQVRPVVYLNYSIAFNENGNGSYDNPYQLSEVDRSTNWEPPVYEVSTDTSLIEYITDLYTSSNPTEVNDQAYLLDYGATFDRTFYYSYLDADSTWGIMNDGLDSNGNETGNINQGNIRYFGKNPENYIYFNCSDYNNQTETTCEKWRIVGIVDGKVKIMKNNIIGNYEWDSNGEIDWPNATLKVFLNEGDYYAGLETNNSKTPGLISESTWYINSYNISEEPSNYIYKMERTGTSTWDGNIALLYPSDYGYSTDLNRCKYTLLDYGTDDCPTYNWMTNIMTSEESVSSWLLTPDLENNYAWAVYYTGAVGNSSWDDLAVDDMRSVVPTLYLDINLKINDVGDGTEGNPYRLVVE